MRGFVVVLMALVGDDWVDIARYDSAHGRPHEDVLGRKSGLLEKIWHDNLSNREVYDLAITRFRCDYETIRARYLAR